MIDLLDRLKTEKDFRNILIVAGIFFIFYGFSESFTSFRPLPGSYPYFRAIGGIFVTSGMLLHMELSDKRFWILPIIIAIVLFVIPLSNSIPVVKITSPQKGDEVNISTTISGTISGKLPENQYMWLVVHPHSSGNWWPQGGRINPGNGQWYMPAQFGGENETGMKFDIAVILINGKDDEEYAEYFKTRQQTGNQTVDYPGMPFPASANTIYQITVTQNYSRYK